MSPIICWKRIKRYIGEQGGGPSSPEATALALTTQPSPTATAGAAFAQQPVVQIVDQFDEPFALADVLVSATILSGEMGSVLVGAVSVLTDENGVATFSDLGIGGLLGAHVLQFTDLDELYVPVESDAIDLDTPGAPDADNSSITALLAEIDSTEADPTTGTITAVDAYGNPIPDIDDTDISFAVENLSGVPVSGSLSSLDVDVAGIAADDVDECTVSGVVLDVLGDPVEGATVVLAVTGSGHTITQPDPTDASGAYSGSFTSDTPGVVTVSAEANSVAIFETQNVAVGFVLASHDFESGVLSPFENPFGADVAIVADPTGGGKGDVAEVTLAATVGSSTDRGFRPPLTMRTLSYNDEIWMRAEFYLSDMSGTDADYDADHNRKIFDWQGSGARIILHRRDGELRFTADTRNSSGVVVGIVGNASTGITLDDDTWYTIDVHLVMNSAEGVADGELHLYMDGSPTPDYSRTTSLALINDYNANPTYINNYRLGSQLTIDSGHSGAYTDIRYFNDVYFSTERLP